MKKNLFIFAIAFCAAAALCLALAGCSGGGEAGDANAGGNASATDEAAADAESGAESEAEAGGDAADQFIEELRNTRELSWEGTELTATLGANKDTGCEWNVQFEDDSIIDYSINRKFKLSDAGAMKGMAVGTSAIGFEGKNPGTTRIFLATPCDWDGNEPGYSYTITVTVGEGGAIVDAVGE